MRKLIGVPYGVPYGRADVDATGYYVTCPKCGYKFYGQGSTEDKVTKSAGLEYTIHYEKTHERTLVD